jgi:hypothetical protein
VPEDHPNRRHGRVACELCGKTLGCRSVHPTCQDCRRLGSVHKRALRQDAVQEVANAKRRQRELRRRATR